MKRVLIALVTALPLAVGVASAQAAPTGFPGFPGFGAGMTQQEAVVGTVVSVDPSAGTFVANATMLTPPSFGSGFPGFPFPGFGGTGGTGGTGGSGSGFPGFPGFPGFGSGTPTAPTTPTTPTTTQVTITTNASTTIFVAPGFGSMGGMGGMGGMSKGMTSMSGTVSNLVPGAKFLAFFPGSSSDTIQTLVANPATAILAQVPEQFYAFVGTVTSTDTTAGTVTVNAMRTLPSGLVANGSSATFTVGSHTFIIGGSSLTGSGHGLFGGLFGGSLSGVSQGDIVAGGLIGPAGMTATQIEAAPLMFLLDLPAPAAGTGTTTTTSAERKALNEVKKLLHGGKVKLERHRHARKAHGRSHASRAGR